MNITRPLKQLSHKNVFKSLNMYGAFFLYSCRNCNGKLMGNELLSTIKE